MSDMTPQEAHVYLAAWSTGDSVDLWKTRAARTIVAQAEQIGRLQAALREADWNWWGAFNNEYDYTCSPEGLVSTYEALAPGDMEARHEWP